MGITPEDGAKPDRDNTSNASAGRRPKSGKGYSRLLLLVAVVVVVGAVVAMFTLFGNKTVKFGESYTWKDGPTCIVAYQSNGVSGAVHVWCENTGNVIIETHYGGRITSRTSTTETGTYSELVDVPAKISIAVEPHGYDTVTWK